MIRNTYSAPIAFALALLALILGVWTVNDDGSKMQEGKAAPSAAVAEFLRTELSLATPSTGVTAVNDNGIEDLRAAVHSLSASTDEALRELQSQLSAIQQEQARISELLTLSSGSQESQSEIHDHADFEEQRDRKQAAMQSQFERLETRFGSEMIDQGWAGSMQSEIEHALFNADVGTLHQVSVDCRTSFCRLEVPESVDEGDAGSIDQVREVLSWPGESFYHWDQNTGMIVGYLVRDGQTLWKSPDSR